MRKRSQVVFVLSSVFLGVLAWEQPSWAQVKANQPLPKNQENRHSPPADIINSQNVVDKFLRSELKKADLPTTTVVDWRAQLQDYDTRLAQAQTQITGVQLNTTEAGLTVILEAAEPLPAPALSTAGNVLTAEIDNAVLVLPEGNQFQQANPAPGIAQVQVTSLPDNRVQVTITGTGVPPTAAVGTAATGLTLSVEPAQVGEEEETEITVTAEQEQEGYRVPDASAATKTNTPIRDVPGSIQVIPRQVLKDQSITRIRDAVFNVSGVTPGGYGSQTTVGEGFILRGFDTSASGSTFINGFRRFTDTGYGRDLDIANIEQIEILKGPASVLYGQGEPGGIINIATKQPLPDAQYIFDGTIGSFDFYRPTLDITGPLNAEKSIRYRFNAAYQNSGSYVDFVDTESGYFAPVLSFDIGKNTTLTLEGEYFNFAKSSYNGIPALGTVIDNPLGQLPRSAFLDDPFSRTYYELGSIGYRFQHQFNDNWSIRNAFRGVIYRIDEGFVFGDGVQADNRTLNRGGAYSETDGQSYTLQTDITGKIQTGKVTQDLLFGLDLGWNRYDLRSLEASAGVPPIDIFNPVYTPIDFDTFRDSSEASQNTIGLYAQNLISIGEQFTILLGGRFDIASGSYEDSSGTAFEQEDTAFSPRVGVVYKPIQPVSLYASWSRSFLPSSVSSRNLDGTPFEPTKGEQFEVGVKTEFLEGRLAATLAAYQITKTNVITTDPNIPGFSIQVGEQRNRGLEFDLVGRVAPGLNLIATYAYIDAKITENNDGNVGNRPANVPEHTASLWATYEIQKGTLKGLGFGGGFVVVGSRQGDLENTFTLPGYVRADAAIYYRRDNWRVGLNFKNLSNVYYFEGAEFGSVFPGAPFTVQGSVVVEF
ncbi:MAG: TonB-dependent siderophore receptor [Acaryochloris sp. SU_5_25]|nr:TonB-dependent siderophore receptor [Acaryochloris sp. SU_5_25]